LKKKELQGIGKNINGMVISFSGGRTSAFMAKLLIELPKYKYHKKLIIFANTGKESESTLRFIDRCDKEWDLGVVWIESVVQIEKGKGTNYRVVDFETANRNGKPFEDVINKYGLPSKLYRHCTRELKAVIINKYAKDVFGTSAFLTAIGIRADEKHRLGSDPKKIYPLAELGFTEDIIRNWWDNQDFDLELKDYEGNCDLCFLKSVRKKLTLISEDESKANWWAEMEEKYSKEFQDKFDVYRNLSIYDLVEKAKKPFSKINDKHELNKQQGSLFKIDMDLEFDCFCKAS